MVITSVIISFPCALIFGGFSALIDPIQVTFAATTTMTVIAFTLLRAESGFAVPLAGFLVDTYGSRVIILVGGILIGIGSVIEPVLVFFINFSNCLEKLLSLIQPNLPPCLAVGDELN